MHTTEMLCFLREAHRGLRDQDEHFRNTDRLYQGGSERLPFLEPTLTGLSGRQSAALQETQEWPQRKVPRETRTASNGKNQTQRWEKFRAQD